MRRLIPLALLSGLTIVALAAAAVGLRTAGRYAPLSRVIYSANLSTPVPGWYQSRWSTFDNGAYEIRIPSVGQNLIREPPDLIRPHAAITLRASLNVGTSAQSAFGIYCLADYKNAGFAVSFLIHRDDEWTIYEYEGNQPQKLLAWGSAPKLNVVRPTSITAVCDALPNKIKLGLYVNGHVVSSLTEPSPKLDAPWLMRLDAYRANSVPTVVRVKSFVLRNLAG